MPANVAEPIRSLVHPTWALVEASRQYEWLATGRRATSKVLRRSRFQVEFPTLPDALADLLSDRK